MRTLFWSGCAAALTLATAFYLAADFASRQPHALAVRTVVAACETGTTYNPALVAVRALTTGTSPLSVLFGRTPQPVAKVRPLPQVPTAPMNGSEEVSEEPAPAETVEFIDFGHAYLPPPVIANAPCAGALAFQSADERESMPPCADAVDDAPETMPYCDDTAADDEPSESVAETWERLIGEGLEEVAAEDDAACPEEECDGCEKDPAYQHQYPGCPFSGCPGDCTEPACKETCPEGGAATAEETQAEEQESPVGPPPDQHHHYRERFVICPHSGRAYPVEEPADCEKDEPKEPVSPGRSSSPDDAAGSEETGVEEMTAEESAADSNDDETRTPEEPSMNYHHRYREPTVCPYTGRAYPAEDCNDKDETTECPPASPAQPKNLSPEAGEEESEPRDQAVDTTEFRPEDAQDDWVDFDEYPW